MVRYWYNPDTDDYTTSNSIPEMEECVYFGYQEIDREEFDAAMHRLKD